MIFGLVMCMIDVFIFVSDWVMDGLVMIWFRLRIFRLVSGWWVDDGLDLCFGY